VFPSVVAISVRLSPICDLYEHPNPKKVAEDLKSAFNRLPIRETYFELYERYNSNMSIISPENPFAGRILFLVILSENMSNEF